MPTAISPPESGASKAPGILADEAGLLHLLWLASPALPVGGFSYSEGLEAAVDAGRVHDEATTTRWLIDQLHLVQARSDLPLLNRAHQAWCEGDAPAVQRCNDWVLHTRETRELRLQTEQMGRSLAEWLRQRAEAPAVATLQTLRGGPTWPVAYALAGHAAGVSARAVMLACAFAWAENQVQAAIKCVPLGQSAGQRILAALVREIPTAVEAAQSLPPSQHQAFAPGLAVLSARHEQQYSRLFRS